MTGPKIKLLYFKNILDRCFYGFFEDYNDCFIRNNGLYILSKDISEDTLRDYFRRHIRNIIMNHIDPFDVTNPAYMFIIGGCFPSDNMLLDYRKGYFPEKLDSFLKSDSCCRYILKEKDIRIDTGFFNRCIDGIFDELFRSSGARKLLGVKYTNVFAVKHNRLGCYAMFKTLKYLYGKNSCVNVWLDEFEDKRSCVTAVNDLICRYVNNKTEMNRSTEFRDIVKQVKQYADQCIGGCATV